MNMSIAKHYHIFGQRISQSLSPAIHNAAFSHHGLPHRYDIRECGDIDEVQPLINDVSFGGASVTMPHKLFVSKFCTEQSDSALRIGAINTLVVQDDDDAGGRTIRGENTDWSGLHSIITEKAPPSSSIGLVFGAGGAGRAAIYAMIKANIDRIYICNRTLSKAQNIARDFTDLCPAIHCISNPGDMPESPDVIIGTIPAEATNEKWFSHLFQESKGGLCIEMSYKPRLTPLLSVAWRYPGWSTADGLEVLLRQGFEQSRLWVGVAAPEERMRSAVKEVVGDAGNWKRMGARV